MFLLKGTTVKVQVQFTPSTAIKKELFRDENNKIISTAILLKSTLEMFKAYVVVEANKESVKALEP